jgi:hypothetical protein
MINSTSLRNRLTYGNVVSTIALFFAFTGASMAGVKYLAPSDPIPPTSDLGGSTYGNPLIADGRVTSAKIANGAITTSKFASNAVAPDTKQFGGRSLDGFGLVVARGTRSVSTNVSPGTCNAVRQDAPGVRLGFDVAIVNGPPVAFLTVDGIVDTDDSFLIQYCNLGSFDVGSGDYHYRVLR